MTYAEAAELLERMCAADTDPALTYEDIEALLKLFRTPDRFGVGPNQRGWEPSWDLNAAAAEGWRWKAGRCADRFAFSADGATYNRNQVAEHCLAQAKIYSARAIRALDTARFSDDPYDFRNDLA